MKYIKLFENFESYDPYELMIIPPNKKAEMIVREIKKSEPNLNLVSDLIVLGANLEWQDGENFNRTPLHRAAGYGRVEVVRMLIDAGADLDVQNNWGWTPLHYAIGNGQVEIARMLIGAGARKDIPNNQGNLPYDLAYNEELKKLLEPNLSESFEPHDPYELMIIPPNKKAEMIVGEIKKNKPNLNLVNDLIVLGANVNVQDNDDNTPFHWAAYYGRVEIARMLIDAGADVNVQDTDDWAPLHYATRDGILEIVQMLIDAKANLDVQDEDGRTPLHWAAGTGRVEIARMLIGAGADVNVQNEFEQTPLHLAARDGRVEIARMLIGAGARKDIRDDEGRTPYDLARSQKMKKLLKP